LRKVPAVSNILPGGLLRKLVRKAIHESESQRNPRLEDGLLSGGGLNRFTLIFCFGALSGAEAGTGRGARLTAVTSAHESLQMPVKYEDDVFQTHRQMHAVV
jgi:hypothetical protein